MPVAVITGASQGLGPRPRARPRRARLVARRSTPATPDRLAAAVAALPGGPHRRRSPATSPTLAPRAPSPRPPRLGGADLLVNNASTLGPQPAAGLRRPRPRRPTPRILEVNVVAPIALTARAAAPAPRAGRPGRSTSPPTPRSRPTRPGAATAPPRPRSTTRRRILAAEQPELRVYAVDPGDLRTAMHQDAFPGEDISDRPRAGDRRARADRPGRRRPAERPVPRAATRQAVPRVTQPPSPAPTRPPCAPPGRPPEARGLARDEVRLAVATPDGTRHHRAAALPDLLAPGDLLVVNTSATLPAAVDVQRHGCTGPCTSRPSSTTAPGSSSCGCPTTPARRPATPARCCGCPAASGSGSLEPHPAGQPRLWRARAAARDRPGRTTSRSTATRSATATSTASGRSTRLQNVYAEQPGSAEMPSAGRPLTDGCWCG